MYSYSLGYVFATDYGTVGTQAALTAALAAISISQKVLYLQPGTWSITADLTIPSNVTLKVERGVVLSIATTKTLTINGGLDAGLYQVFSCVGTGKVVFGSGSVKEVYPQWWGAIADNSTDSTSALQAAFYTFGGTTGIGGTVSINGLFKITNDLILPRRVNLCGVNTDSDGISAASVKTITISGTSAKGWSFHKTTNLTLDYVGLSYGATTSDGGQNTQVIGCNISNCTYGIKYKHYSWMTLIDGCDLNYNTYGVYFDLSGATSSGSAVRISNSTMHNNTTGVYFNGIGADGFDCMISNTDIENNTDGIITTSATDGVISLNNIHFENNTNSNIINDGSKIFINNVWDGESAGVTASYINTTGVIKINSGRLFQGAGAKMFSIAAGSIYFNWPQIVCVGPDTTALAIPTSAVSFTLPHGYVYSTTWGGSQALTAAAYTFDTHYAGEYNAREYKFALNITTGIGSTPGFLLRYTDNSTPMDCLISLPNETGIFNGRAMVSSSRVIVEGTFTGTATTKTYRQSVANTLTIDKLRYVHLYGTGLAGTGAISITDMSKAIQ